MTALKTFTVEFVTNHDQHMVEDVEAISAENARDFITAKWANPDVLSVEPKSESNKPVVNGPIDGNAFAIIAAVGTALKKAGLGEEADKFRTDAFKCGSYDALLQLSMKHVDFENL
jgi:hypothetical protein